MSQCLIDSILLHSKFNFSSVEEREYLPVHSGLERISGRLTAPYTPLKPSSTFSTVFYPSCQLICCFRFLSSFRILCMNWLISCWFILLQAHSFIFFYLFYSTKSVASQISSFLLLNVINSSYMYSSCCKFVTFMD